MADKSDKYKKAAKDMKDSFTGGEEEGGVWGKIKDFGKFAMRGKSLRDSLKEKKKKDS